MGFASHDIQKPHTRGPVSKCLFRRRIGMIGVEDKTKGDF